MLRMSFVASYVGHVLIDFNLAAYQSCVNIAGCEVTSHEDADKNNEQIGARDNE